MSTKTGIKFAGLADYPNALGDAPPGSLQVATNVVANRPGVLSSRKGQRTYSTTSLSEKVPTRFVQAGNSLYGFFTFDGAPTSPGELQRIDSGSSAATAAGGTLTPPPNNAIHSAEVNNNVYLTTDDGVQKLAPLAAPNASSGTLVPAGMPAGMDIKASVLDPTGGSLGFLAGGYATAYRVVFGNVDAAGNVILGAPSPPFILSNPAFEDIGPLTFTQALGDPFVLNTAYYFQVALGFTAQNTLAGVAAKIVQGSEVRDCLADFTSGQSTADVRLVDTAFYFGAAGAAVTLVFPISAASVATSTTLTISGGAASTTPMTWVPTAGTTGLELYAPYNDSAPADASAAVTFATVSAATNTTVTASTGTWQPGATALITTGATIDTPQKNRLVFVAGTDVNADLQVNDALALTGCAFKPTISSTGTDLSNTYKWVELVEFPTGVDVSGVYTTVTSYRSQNATVTFNVPHEVQAYTDAGLTAFAQVYRSFVQQQIVDGTTTQPTDTMQQAWQVNWTTTPPSSYSFTDLAPDATLGTTLYTSPTQGGILNAKYQPPVASDMCYYANTMLYANCWIPASYDFRLLGVASSNDGSNTLQPGDVITICGHAFTAVTGAPGANQFQLETSLDSTTANINQTVLNFCYAVNAARLVPTSAGSSLEQVVAYSTIDPTGMGGTFTLRTSRGLGTISWAYSAHTPTHNPWENQPTSAITPTHLGNTLYYSNTSEPEAVPLLNSIQVGQANTPILRVLPLPGSAIVFKPEGIFQLSGNTPAQFSVTVLNTTAQLLANESAVLLQSSIFAYTSQGVVTVSQGGVQIVSVPINDTLRALQALSAFSSTTFAVGNEGARQYLLFVPSVDSDNGPTQAFVYSVLTNCWTRWGGAPTAPTNSFNRFCGIVNRADQALYLGTDFGLATEAPAVLKEAMPADLFPLTGDESVPCQITAIVGNRVVLNPSFGTASFIANYFPPGSSLVLGSGAVVACSAVTAGPDLTVTAASTAGMTVGATVTLVAGTICVVAPLPITPEDPGIVKQFQEFEVGYQNAGTPTSAVTAVLATDFGTDSTALTLAPTVTVPPAPVFLQTVRQLVTRGAARGRFWWPTITATVAANEFELVSLTVTWAPTRSTRSR